MNHFTPRIFGWLTAVLLLSTGLAQAAATSLAWVHPFAATDPNTGQAPEGFEPSTGLVLGFDNNFYGLVYHGSRNTGADGKSVFYKVTPAGDYTVLYVSGNDTFAGLLDASTPLVAAANSSDGKLVFYHAGGGGSDTNLFRITTDGTAAGTTVTNIYQFDSTTSGISVRGALYYDGRDGSGSDVLYGAAYGGGTHNRGTIFKVVTNGAANGTVVTILHSFGTANDPQDGYPWTTLTKGTDGNLYGTTTDTANTFLGETQVDNGKIFQLSPTTGAYNVLYTYPLNGQTTPSSLVESAPGIFFGTARSSVGGPGIIFKLTVTGSSASYETVYTFSSNASVPMEYAPLFLDQDGLMYGVLDFGGVNHTGEIFSFSPDGTVTDLYDFSRQQNNTDGYDPTVPVAVDAAGNIYGTATSGGAYGNGTIYKLNAPPKPPLAAFSSFDAQAPSTDGGSMHFTASGAHNVKVVVQFTTDGTSWRALLDGGVMTEQPTGSGNYMLDSAAYPAGQVTFRAVATKPGSTRTVSANKGPFTLHMRPRLSATGFTVNESSTPQAGLTDTVLRFAATQSGAPTQLFVRVQASTDNSTWTDLTDNNNGRMGYDPNLAEYVLNSTSYPASSTVWFRARATGAGIDPSYSNPVGPFVLSSNLEHVAPPQLVFIANGHRADFDFEGAYPTAPTGVTVRVQVSNTPAEESSWSNFDQAGFAAMTQTSNPRLYRYLLNKSPYPDGSNIFFRVRAEKSAFGATVSGVSMPCGPFSIVAAKPVVITVFPPASQSGSGTEDDPFIISGDTLSVTANAIASAGRTVATLALQLNGATKAATNTDNITASMPMPGVGDYVLQAIGADDLGAVGRAAGAIFIRVVASSSSAAKGKAGETSAASDAGKVFTAIADGNWTDAAIWRDQNGQGGVPYLEDFAIIKDHTVTITPGTTVYAAALTLRGAHLVGNTTATDYAETTASQLKVSGTFTITQTATMEGWMHVESDGLLELQNISDVRFIPGASGLVALIESKGGCNVHGAGGITGARNFLNESPLQFLPPLSIPPDAPTNPTAGLRLVQAVTGSGGITSLEKVQTASDGSAIVRIPGVKVVVPDGNGLIGQDGNGMVSNDGGTLIGQDGNGLIGQDGNGLIGQDGNGLIGQDGNGIVSQGGGNVITPRNGGASGRPAQGEAANVATNPALTLNGGEVDLDGITVAGDLVLNGGVLSGSGAIYGNLINNGGYITPGHSAGHLMVTGDFSQAAGGTLVIENGGFLPSQFDALLIGGAANLGGKLDVKTLNGYAPGINDTFCPLSYSSVSGTFSSISSNANITIGATGLVASDDITKPQPVAGQPANVSTRGKILTGDNVLIGGFIITGQSGTSKKVLVRGLGPSLSRSGVPGVLSDPAIEVHYTNGTVVANDDWQTGANQGQIPADFRPDAKEAALMLDLTPGAYTVIEKGAHGETGVGLVEIYDFDASTSQVLANISTRGFVGINDDVMIGGFIVTGSEPAQMLVRALGPSLAQNGVANVLADPQLELHDTNGNVISNDDWRETQESDIRATGIAPTNDKEAALLVNLPPGAYTGIVRGKNNTTGVALIEVYKMK